MNSTTLALVFCLCLLNSALLVDAGLYVSSHYFADEFDQSLVIVAGNKTFARLEVSWWSGMHS